MSLLSNRMKRSPRFEFWLSENNLWNHSEFAPHVYAKVDFIVSKISTFIPNIVLKLPHSIKSQSMKRRFKWYNKKKFHDSFILEYYV